MTDEQQVKKIEDELEDALAEYHWNLEEFIIHRLADLELRLRKLEQVNRIK